MYLALNEHCHVHEHVMQFLDRRLELDNVCMPSLNVGQGLLRLGSVHHDPLREDGGVALKNEVKVQAIEYIILPHLSRYYQP